MTVEKEMRDMMSAPTSGDIKLDKSTELNENMTISAQAPDELENKIKNLG